MKIQKQLIKHDPDNGQYGDCYRTCIACILDMDASEVPNFCDQSQPDVPWSERQDRWLAELGLAVATFAYDGNTVDFNQVMVWTSKQSPYVPMILCGLSSIGVNHSVVVLAGNIVCDPSGNGIVGPSQESTWEISVISVAATA